MQNLTSLVENSQLAVNRTLDKLGVARCTFYMWFKKYLTRGEAGLSKFYRGPVRHLTACLKVKV